MDNDKLPTKTPDSWDELYELRERMDKTKDPDPKDVDRFRKLAVSAPDSWPLSSLATDSVRHQLIEKISNGSSRACLLAEVDLLKQRLDYDAAPALEQLLIEHILTARLRVLDAENRYNAGVVNQSVSLNVGIYWDNLLTSTQARFLRAIDCLARVRRLARNTPALQINIAREGGKQVNVQGE
jgi:hypothetical protein